MLQNPNFPGIRPELRWGSLERSPDPLTDEEGLALSTPALGLSGLVSTGLRVSLTTELATLLMIDFKCRPIWSSYFSVSQKGENVLGYEGADGRERESLFVISVKQQKLVKYLHKFK